LMRYRNVLLNTTVSQMSDRLRLATTGQARGIREQGTPMEAIHRGDGRRHMAFRPHRERPAA
jgi:hypothetical protein